MKRLLLLVIAAASAGAGAWSLSQAAERAVEARRQLVSELSTTLGRARMLDTVAQQVRSETGTARPAATLLEERIKQARTAQEQELLTQSLACLTDGGCTDATAPISQAQQADGDAVAVLWKQVDVAEGKLYRAFQIALALGLLGVALAGFSGRSPRPAPLPPEAAAPTEAVASAEPAAGSDERAMEEMLRARLEALYQARAQLGDNARFAAFGELAAALSHGLKTPLAGVLASVQLAQLKLGDTHAARGELEEVVRQTEGLTEQVQRFLRAAGKVGPQRQHVRCAEVLQPLDAAYTAEASRRGITFTVNNAASAAAVEVDRSLLDMALRNLIENALAVVERGQSVSVSATEVSAPARVGLEAAPPPAGVRFLAFVVDDQGPGLPAAARRTETGSTTRAQGSGLGLAIARRVAERHDGALVLEDRQGGGTRIQLVLPVAGPEAS